MTLSFIKREDLTDGAYYLGECKYAYIATWSASKNEFEYMNNSSIYSAKYYLDEGEDTFSPLFEIKMPNIDVVMTGQLQVQK